MVTHCEKYPYMLDCELRKATETVMNLNAGDSEAVQPTCSSDGVCHKLLWCDCTLSLAHPSVTLLTVRILLK